MDTAARLRQMRKQFRLTLADVASKTDLSVSFLSDVERGRTRPSLETLERLAKVYETSVSELVEVETADNWTMPSIPGLSDFYDDMRKKGLDIDKDVFDLMLRIDRRSQKHAETAEDWRRVYYSLQNMMR